MIQLDTGRCLNCGACARACSMGIFRMGEAGIEFREKKNCLRCYHCTAACPAQAIHFEDVAPELEYQQTTGDQVEALVTGRRSVRHFRQTLPDRADMIRALDLAQYAPSGKNDHLTAWTILYGAPAVTAAREMVLEWSEVEKVHPELRYLAKRGKDPVTCGAPCILLAHASPQAANPVVDAAIQAATAELLLCRQGLGTCWGGYFTRAANAWAPLRAYLGLPEGEIAVGALLVGYADREAYPNRPYRAPAKLSWKE